MSCTKLEDLSPEKLRIVKRAAEHVKETNPKCINLGFGVSENLIMYKDLLKDVFVQAESCVYGMNSFEGKNPWHIDAGGNHVTMRDGACRMRSTLDSFSLMYSGRIEQTYLGALQVAENGDLANWAISEFKKPGIGGAVELAEYCKEVVVCMLEFTKKGDRKLVKECTMPLTGKKCVNLIITECGVYKPAGDHFEVLELWDENKQEYVKTK